MAWCRWRTWRPRARRRIVDGEITAAGGEAAYQYVVKAVELALADRIGVIVTAPLNKGAMHAAGHHFDGHTELLAHLSGREVVFHAARLEQAVGGARLHPYQPARRRCERATTERVLATIRAGNEHFKALGYASPRIAVAGLNPHCGEGGIFGNEEIDHINRAVEQAQQEGINAKGPISGDTVFYRTSKGEFDLVVAQYHDQGHIPDQADRLRRDGEREPRAADPPHLGGPRDGVRHRLEGQGEPRQHARCDCVCTHDGGRAAAARAAA